MGDSLFASRTYRELLRNWLEYRKSLGKPLKFSEISRHAGFASRSFPRDVLLGSKRLTLNSLHPMIRGLGLSGDLALLFQLLVEAEHPDCRIKGSSDEKIRSRLNHLRSRVLKKGYLPKEKAAGFFSHEQFPAVYAALGNSEQGATVREILARTRMPKPVVLQALNKLAELGVVERKGTAWRAGANHLNSTGLSDPKSFERFFKAAQARAADSMDRLFATQEALYFGTCFSVNARELPELKSRLRSLLMEYAEQAEVAEGDRVVTLTASLV